MHLPNSIYQLDYGTDFFRIRNHPGQPVCVASLNDETRPMFFSTLSLNETRPMCERRLKRKPKLSRPKSLTSLCPHLI
jgi:hypothetical protein